jgi:hypothetical protein
MMMHVTEWSAHVHLFETDSVTQARVTLDTGAAVLTGEGLARRNPTDPLVPEVGDELAVGRALVELGRRLIAAAAEDVSVLDSARVASRT